jgi:hypothetical protein
MTWQERARLPEVRVEAARAAYFAAVEACLQATLGSAELEEAFVALKAAEFELELSDWLADDGGMLDDAEVMLVLELVAGAIRGRVRDETARRVLEILDHGLTRPARDSSDSAAAAILTRRACRAA